MKEEFNDIKKKLVTRIWKTKKSRMNCEARLLGVNKFYQILVIYYSIVITGFSILALLEHSDWISFIIIISSITLIIISVYLSSQNYIKRANDIKNNYTKIAELEIKLELLNGEFLTSDNIELINCEYQELLRQVENHNSIDCDKLNSKKPIMYWVRLCGGKVIQAVLVLIPLTLLIINIIQVFSDRSNL